MPRLERFLILQKANLDDDTKEEGKEGSKPVSESGVDADADDTEEGEVKDTSGAAANAADEDAEPCYDKKKSFFDSISCEALERSKGKNTRPDWRAEKKLNKETFGVAGPGGGGYRGGYRNYNHRGGFRGGYNNRGYNRGGYRGGEKSFNKTLHLFPFKRDEFTLF